ncbi:MAG TPA: histidine phosphatase family protein [Acidimicrobiia bacterium]|jgi:broad specificity phosphatase PhoE|nr:histidine phosphatase family protein [Acidimicrobiia bacterium]
MLVLVRHGQTDANARGLLLGRADPPLSELGRHQAAALAAHVPADARLVASPLVRAQETAAALGGPVEVDDRWIELDYGSFDGRPVADVPAAVWREWRADPHYVPPGGESLAMLGTRVRAACDDLLEEARERDVVVVSHVSPIKAAIGWALGAGDEIGWHMFVQLASIARIAIGPWGPSLHSFNETA